MEMRIEMENIIIFCMHSKVNLFYALERNDLFLCYIERVCIILQSYPFVQTASENLASLSFASPEPSPAEEHIPIMKMIEQFFTET